VRKFFCDRPTCERTIFAQRLDEVARLYARSTDRHREALEWIAFALGGEAGARLARELGLLVSPDALLNRIRGAFRAEAEDVRALGVDDFGFRKGNAPGTILVDLERHKVADLFEGHSGESIARWLRRHPGVEEAAGCEASVIKKFAASLRKDLAAARAGLTEEWSTGAVEGFITKLKLLKRQGYGRANFEFLRARALAA
jgi:hypothetical protein